MNKPGPPRLAALTRPKAYFVTSLCKNGFGQRPAPPLFTIEIDGGASVNKSPQYLNPLVLLASADAGEDPVKFLVVFMGEQGKSNFVR